MRRSVRDVDVVGGKASVVAVVDGSECGLQMAGIGRAIEERSGGADLLQVLMEGLHSLGIAGKLDSEFFIL
jgi:hypothetical protein